MKEDVMRRTAVVLWVVSVALVVLSGVQSVLLWLTGPGEGPSEPIFTILVFAPVAILLSLIAAWLWHAGSPARVRRRGPVGTAAVWLWLLAASAELVHLVFLVAVAEPLAVVLALWAATMGLLGSVNRRASRTGGGTMHRRGGKEAW